jgi:hypothetical protein
MNLDKREEMARKRAVWLRNYQRARGRALTRLAQQYPDQFKEILEEERLSDEANGKAWLDISGTTATDVGFYLPPHRQDSSYRSKQADTDEQDKGNVGGEE